MPMRSKGKSPAKASASSRSSRSKTSAGSRGAARSSGAAKTTTDHDTIRRWIEERNGQPACVRGTGGKGDPGMLRVNFPGFTGEETLQKISWDEFFDALDENNLAFLHQDRIKGNPSRFFKFVDRNKTAGAGGKSRSHGHSAR